MRTFLLAALMAIIGTQAFAQRRDRSMPGFEFGPRTPEPGEVCHDVELLSIRDGRVRLSDARGKYVVFEFVHPGNEVAAGKIPVMNTLRAKYANEGRVEFWTVLGSGNYDRNGRAERQERPGTRERVDEAKWTSMLKEQESRFEGTKLVSDADLAIARTVYGGFINQTYLIGPDGRVVDRWSWCDPGALETALDRELGIRDAPRVTTQSVPVRPQIPVGERVRASRRRVQAIPVAQELVRGGAKKFLSSRDKDGSGELALAEAGFAEELFRRVDRDQSGSLSLEEIQLAEEAAAQRLP